MTPEEKSTIHPHSIHEPLAPSPCLLAGQRDLETWREAKDPQPHRAALLQLQHHGLASRIADSPGFFGEEILGMEMDGKHGET